MDAKQPNKKRIFVGLSGGVDSSVAALRLKRAGHDVIGVFIKTWHPDFIVCNEEAERHDAMRVAAHLKIPFLTFDAEDAYKKDVADYMIREYAAGRTPNPDIMCNKYVKFGAFLEFANKEGADAVATGHYARITPPCPDRTDLSGNTFRLLRGKDTSKDQSYFLSALTEAQLAKIYFPIGDSEKEEIRKEAKAAGLPTASKPDSQGICFLGEIDLKDFLSHYIAVERGEVLDEQGNVIGEHTGALFYTLGERHGFTVHNADVRQHAHYVVKKDIMKNTLTVRDHPPMIEKGGVVLTDLNELVPWGEELHAEAQFRYRQKPFKVEVRKKADGTASVKVLESVETPSPGQVCVLYLGEVCLGGGIIS